MTPMGNHTDQHPPVPVAQLVTVQCCQIVNEVHKIMNEVHKIMNIIFC